MSEDIMNKAEEAVEEVTEKAEETKKKVEEVTETAEKKMTKYDRKMQKRAEEKAKEKKSLAIWKGVGIAFLALIAIWIISIPVRSYLTVNGTYIKVDGDPVSKVEYDYYYNSTVNNYMSNYGYYLYYYYGLESVDDLDSIMYDDTLTFKDYLEQSTVEQIKQNKALAKEIKSTGFTADVDEDYDEYLEQVKAAAEEAGETLEDYYKEVYGDYATVNRLEKYVKEGLLYTAYYNEKYDSFAPTDDEINAYYEENSGSYDLVDYRLTTIYAELPTEPTDLADDEPEYDDDGNYTPSDAEVEAAMEEAYTQAKEAEATVSTDGDLQEGLNADDANYYLTDWLFDDSRVEGDTTIVENSNSNLYYVAEFISRYQDEEPTVDIRAIFTEEDNGQEIVDAYNEAGATEEAFIELVKKYSTDTTAEDGLYEGQSADYMDEELSSWAFSDERAAGDVMYYYDEDGGMTYVLYYIGTDKPEWYFEIKSTLQSEAMTEYLDSITEGIEVEDPKGNLEYLTKLAAAEEAAEDAETDTDAESTGSEDTGSEDSEDADSEAEESEESAG